MAHIQLFGTGGTIASRSSGHRGAVATDTAADVARSHYGDLTVSTHDLLTTGSYRLGLGDLRTIAEHVREALDDPANDGVVVTHGTDTVEETAFLLDLVHGSPRSVVLTGAQQPADSLTPDGPRNVREAALAAADHRLRGAGALVSFAGTVRSARGIRKARTLAADPFQGGIELAHWAGSRLVVTARPARRDPLPMPTAAFDDARVEIVTAYPGATPDLLDHTVRSGAGAVVLAGTGTGNAGPGFVDAVRGAVAAGCAVVLGTRAPWGPVLPVYGNGGGADLVRAGAVPSGDINPYQARILLALLLSHGLSADELSTAFRHHA